MGWRGLGSRDAGQGQMLDLVDTELTLRVLYDARNFLAT
jgi:hypothetical protein